MFMLLVLTGELLNELSDWYYGLLSCTGHPKRLVLQFWRVKLYKAAAFHTFNKSGVQLREHFRVLVSPSSDPVMVDKRPSDATWFFSPSWWEDRLHVSDCYKKCEKTYMWYLRNSAEWYCFFFFLSLKAFHALPAIILCLCFQVEGYRFSFKLLTVVTLCVVTCSVYRMA